MKKAISVAITPILLISLLTGVANAAAPKAGATCTKAGTTANSNGFKFTCIKTGKKLVWDKGVKVVTPKTPTPTPEVVYYVAKDLAKIQSLTSKDACSNPAKASFEIQALVDGKWLPVKLIESGYKASGMCTDPALGLRNSMAYATFYMDPGTTYRWLYSGEINFNPRDAQGRGISAEFKITAPLPPAPVPVTLPVAQTGAVTFANAASNSAQIPQVAWQNVQDAIATNPDVVLPTTIHIGPNTDASLSAITNGLNRINKLFAGFTHVSKYYGIVYNARDLQWAQNDVASLFQTMGLKGGFAQTEVIKNQSSAGCEINGTTVVECGGGMAWDLRQNNSDAGGSYYGVQSGGYWTDALKNIGPMTQVNHEAMHNYQIIQFSHTELKENQNTSADAMHDATPWWFSEGQANGIGISTFIDKFSDYLAVRQQTVVRNPGPNAKVPTTAEGFKSFLMDPQKASPENANWPLAYSIGYSAVEALIAIGGPRATLALYALGSNGETWETAFKNVYGITWDQGATVLSQVLAAEYAANPIQK
jgi:hypothetical protein